MEALYFSSAVSLKQFVERHSQETHLKSLREAERKCIYPKFQKKAPLSEDVANQLNCKSHTTEIAMFCYCIVERRSVGCKCLTVQNCRTLPWRYAFPFWKPAGKGSTCSLTISTEEGCGSNMAATCICSDQSLYVYSCERERGAERGREILSHS